MESRNENIITKEQFKTLDVNNISRIILKNGGILKLNSNNSINTNLNSICTCRRNNNRKINPRFNTYNNNKNFYVIPVPNIQPKILAIKIPNYEKPKIIKNSIKTFTFESPPRKYKYKPYKTPIRRHKSKIKYTGYKYINPNDINDDYKECICKQYCTCGKFKEY